MKEVMASELLAVNRPDPRSVARAVDEIVTRRGDRLGAAVLVGYSELRYLDELNRQGRHGAAKDFSEFIEEQAMSNLGHSIGRAIAQKMANQSMTDLGRAYRVDVICIEYSQYIEMLKEIRELRALV